MKQRARTIVHEHHHYIHRKWEREGKIKQEQRRPVRLFSWGRLQLQFEINNSRRNIQYARAISFDGRWFPNFVLIKLNRDTISIGPHVQASPFHRAVVGFKLTCNCHAEWAVNQNQKSTHDSQRHESNVHFEPRQNHFFCYVNGEHDWPSRRGGIWTKLESTTRFVWKCFFLQRLSWLPTRCGHIANQSQVTNCMRKVWVLPTSRH